MTKSRTAAAAATAAAATATAATAEPLSEQWNSSLSSFHMFSEENAHSHHDDDNKNNSFCSWGDENNNDATPPIQVHDEWLLVSVQQQGGSSMGKPPVLVWDEHDTQQAPRLKPPLSPGCKKQQPASPTTGGNEHRTRSLMAAAAPVVAAAADLTYCSSFSQQEDESDKLFEVKFQNSTPTVLSTLIRQQKYSAALERLQQHPEEASIWVASSVSSSSSTSNPTRHQQQQQQQQQSHSSHYPRSRKEPTNASTFSSRQQQQRPHRQPQQQQQQRRRSHNFVKDANRSNNININDDATDQELFQLFHSSAPVLCSTHNDDDNENSNHSNNNSNHSNCNNDNSNSNSNIQSEVNQQHNSNSNSKSVRPKVCRRGRSYGLACRSRTTGDIRSNHNNNNNNNNNNNSSRKAGGGTSQSLHQRSAPELKPTAAACSSAVRQLPLHIACKNLKRCSRNKHHDRNANADEPSLLYQSLNELLFHLIAAYPEGCEQVDPQHHVLPLHAAVRYGATPPVISMLAMVHPQSVVQADRYGRTVAQIFESSIKEQQQEEEGASVHHTDQQISEIRALLQVSVQDWERAQKAVLGRLRDSGTPNQGEATTTTTTTTREETKSNGDAVGEVLTDTQKPQDSFMPPRSSHGWTALDTLLDDEAFLVSIPKTIVTTVDVDSTLAQLKEEYQRVHARMDQLLLSHTKRNKSFAKGANNNHNNSRQSFTTKMDPDVVQDVRQIKTEFAQLTEKLDQLELLVLDSEWYDAQQPQHRPSPTDDSQEQFPVDWENDQAGVNNTLQLAMNDDKTMDDKQQQQQVLKKGRNPQVVSSIRSEEDKLRWKRSINFLSHSCRSSDEKLSQLFKGLSLSPSQQHRQSEPIIPRFSPRRESAAATETNTSTGTLSGGGAQGDIEWKPSPIEVFKTVGMDDLTTILRNAAEHYVAAARQTQENLTETTPVSPMSVLGSA